MAKKKTDEAEQIESAVAGAASEVKEKVEKVAEEVEADVKELADETTLDKKSKKKSSDKTEEKSGEADSKKAKLAALKAKAKLLESKVSGDDKTTIKEKVTGEKEEKKEMLVPIEDYLKSSIHLGTRVITPDMRKCVYRRRADGLAVFNTSLLDDKMREAIDYLAQFDAKDMIVVCKREAGWKAVNVFAETLGIRAFTKKYPAGVLTNTNLENFFETDLVFICDPWLDKNAVADANRVKLKVMSVCDTNNFTAGIDFVLPGNNKSWKSLGMVFYLLTRGYIEKKKLGIEVPPIQKFIEGWDALQPPV
ncbi:MAG: 30S ribosomal protein S2 [Nanoarchaeota archaeon]